MKIQMDEDVCTLFEHKVTIFLGPRPGKKSFDALKVRRLTHCCTLLSEREGAKSIEAICQRLGCKWVWLPMDGGSLEILGNTNVVEHISTLAREIRDEPNPRLYFHCSAGIHRTGFFAYVLLRLFRLNRSEALTELKAIRAVTAAQVGKHRLDLADEIVSNLNVNSAKKHAAAKKVHGKIKRIFATRSADAANSQYDASVCVSAVWAAREVFMAVPIEGSAAEYGQSVLTALEPFYNNYNDPDGEYTSGKSSIGDVFFDILGIVEK